MYKNKIPIILTISRIVCIPLIIYLWIYNYRNIGMQYRYLIFIIFILLCLTDMLDGYIARKNNCVSNIGKILDPIADKILVYSILMLLLYEAKIEPIGLIILLAREFIISTLRIYLAQNKITLSAINIAKFKTLIQYTSLAFLILFINPPKIVYNIYYLSIILSVLSLLEYFRIYLYKKAK